MIKRILAVVALVGLSLFAVIACKPSHNVGADDYTFGTPQYINQSVKVNIVTYATYKDLRAAARTHGAANPDVMAFSVLSAPNFDVCTIHMIDPETDYRPEFIGHEFTHCIYGQWHTDNESFQ